MIKFLLKITEMLAIVSLTFLMIACEKENLETEVSENFSDRSSFKMGKPDNFGKPNCFEFVFPITIEIAGETKEIASYEELSALRGNRNANKMGFGQRPSFVFPLQVITADGEKIEVADGEALRALAETCGKGTRGKGPWFMRGKSNCFEFVFPISIEFSDGGTEEIASLEALKTTIQDWRSNKTDGEERPTLVFPLEVVSKDGETITLGDKTAFESLTATCREERGERCFKPIFPISINFPDGSSESYDDKSSMKAALKAWRSQNRESAGRPSIQFPITVELEDGTTQSIDSKEDMLELAATCKEGN